VLPLYAARDHLQVLSGIFAHAFDPASRLSGWPQVDGHVVEPLRPFQIGSTRVTALELPHGRSTVLGYLFESAVGRFAYLTDCKSVPSAAMEQLRGVNVLVLDALRHRLHFGHLTVNEALAVVAETKPERAYFTHICHDLDHATLESQLPPHVRVAYDGLVVDV
jgi:phosphoribosyl 1,2-cyclic phosphate phosphodiesterase